MDLVSAGRSAVIIDFGQRYARARGVGEHGMRGLRLDHRWSYIAFTRLRLALDLEAELGRREPHW